MSRIQEAQQRLEIAINRLDAALQQRLNGTEDQADIATLSQQLEAAQSEYAELQDVTAKVAERLDQTIDRLRKILDEET